MGREEWLTGQELIDRWQIEDFELFECLKKGLQAYTWHGKRIVDEATLEPEKKDSKDTIRKNVLAKEGARTLGSGPGGRGPSSEREIQQKVDYLYNRPENLKLILPPDSIAASFDLPIDSEKAAAMIVEAKTYRFKLSEAEPFGQERGLPSLLREYEPRFAQGAEMEFQEADKEEFPKLRLKTLSRLIDDFLIDRPFARTVYLYHGRNHDDETRRERPYNLLFEVPKQQREIQEYGQFAYTVENDNPADFLRLEEVYRDDKESIRVRYEWKAYVVEDAKDIEREGLHDFVVPGHFVCLYRKDASLPSNLTDKGARTEAAEEENPAPSEENQMLPDEPLDELARTETRWLDVMEARIKLGNETTLAALVVNGRLPAYYQTTLRKIIADRVTMSDVINLMKGDSVVFPGSVVKALHEEMDPTVKIFNAQVRALEQWQKQQSERDQSEIEQNREPRELLADEHQGRAAQPKPPEPDQGIEPKQINQGGMAEELVRKAESTGQVDPEPAAAQAGTAEAERLTLAEKPDKQGGERFFINNGEYWDVGFEDEKKSIRNLKDIQYVLHLLKQPRTRIDVTSLRVLVTKPADGTALYGRETEAELRKQGKSLSDFAEKQWNEDGMTLQDVGTDMLTEEERKVLHDAAERLLEDLEAAKKVGNAKRLAKADEQIEHFRKHCLNEYALKTWIKNGEFLFSRHQMKRLGPSREKDRQLVKNQIDKALKRIEKAKLPKLYEHLSRHIKGGRHTVTAHLRDSHHGG